VNDARMSALGRGLDVLTACDLVSEGVDIPSVSCVLLLTATESLAKYLQWVGRGLRLAPGKTHLTVLDHAGNVLRHGMPDAPREWSLEGRKKRDKTAPPVRQCPECFAAHAPRPTCPACGYVYEVEAPRRAIPESGAGELIEVKRETLPPLKEALKAANSHADVEAIRLERGYKPGWTRAVMSHRRAKFEPYTTAEDDFS
jgi:DNA repair protein RadD